MIREKKSRKGRWPALAAALCALVLLGIPACAAFAAENGVQAGQIMQQEVGVQIGQAAQPDAGTAEDMAEQPDTGIVSNQVAQPDTGTTGGTAGQPAVDGQTGQFDTNAAGGQAVQPDTGTTGGTAVQPAAGGQTEQSDTSAAGAQAEQLDTGTTGGTAGQPAENGQTEQFDTSAAGGQAEQPDTGTTGGTAGQPAAGGQTGQFDTSAAGGQAVQPEGEAGAERLVLADANEDAEVFIYAPMGTSFPKDAVLRILSVEDVIGVKEDRERLCAELTDTLRYAWKDTLQNCLSESGASEDHEASMEEIDTRIRAFFPQYVLLTDQNGNEIPLPGRAEIHFIFRDSTFYEELLARDDRYLAAWQGKGNDFEEIEETEILYDDTDRFVQFRFQTEKLGWFSVLQLDTQPGSQDAEDLDTSADEDTMADEEMIEDEDTITDEDAAEDGDVMMDEDAVEGEDTAGNEGILENEEVPENGEVSGNGEVPENGAVQESEEMSEIEDITESESESGEETEDTEFPEDEEALENQLMTVAVLPSGGTNVTASGSGFVKMSPDKLDGSYHSVRWYSGISSSTPFNTAGNALIEFAGGNKYVFYPNNNSAKGKFGMIWHKILYDNGQWYDLKMTVVNYSDYTYAGTAGTKVTSYPPIVFGTKTCAWGFKPALGEYIIKMEFVKNGDSSQTPVRLNTRFQWWDIDSDQRFGLRTQDGSISAKYYQADESAVCYKTEPAAIDPNNSYLFVTASGTRETGSTLGNIGFALSGCSTYYLAIGFRNHLKESADYRYSENTVKKWNDALKEKRLYGAVGELMQTDLDILIPPDNHYPQKFVSNDRSSFAASNTLPSTTSEFYYRIRQYVPWETAKNYFSSFCVTDVLPAGVDYVGSPSVVRMEDNADMTGKFTVAANSDTVTVTPVASFLENSGFYGYTFEITFAVRMDPTEITASYSGNSASCQVSNTASVQIAFKNGQGNYNNPSNAVTTNASTTRKEQPAPTKGVDGNESQTVKQLGNPQDVIVFSIFQTVPENDEAWRPVQMTVTDTLENCLEYLSTQVYEKGSDGYSASSGWTAGASGQVVTVTRQFSPNNKTYRFDINCRVRPGYDMSAYARTEGNRIWYVIPNTAQVELLWEHGSPQSVKNPTNEAQVRMDAGPVSVRLVLAKEIDTADIVWAHGNPTFLFQVSGEDIDGKKHTYHEMVEFTPANVGDGSRTTLTAQFVMPAGWYTAVEEKTMRYALDSIHDVRNGSVAGNTAVFDLSAGGEAYAAFYNRKTTDAGLTHSAAAINTIGE